MKNRTLRKLTTAAMLTAAALILGQFAFPLFPAQIPFLEYDLCDVLVLITGFSFGPLYGAASSFIIALFQAFILSKSGAFGFIMNIISTSALVLPAALIYYKNKTKKSAVIGLLIGSVTMVIVMIGFNLLITPIFTGMPRNAISSIMPFIALFNVIKTSVNSAITFLIYKHIGKLIKKFN